MLVTGEEEYQKEFDNHTGDEDGNDLKKFSVSFACEDCDYRWDMDFEVDSEEEAKVRENQEYCPMCGSVNTMQI